MVSGQLGNGQAETFSDLAIGNFDRQSAESYSNTQSPSMGTFLEYGIARNCNWNSTAIYDREKFVGFK